MNPECFNRLQNKSKSDLDAFVSWLTSTTLSEVSAMRGDPEATRAAWIRYFRRGLKADLLLGELMDLLPNLFLQVDYPGDEAQKVLEMLKRINFDDLGIKRTETGVRFGGASA
jgi:hypothetical protein